jgi:hypothetical protein
LTARGKIRLSKVWEAALMIVGLVFWLVSVVHGTAEGSIEGRNGSGNVEMARIGSTDHWDFLGSAPIPPPRLLETYDDTTPAYYPISTFLVWVGMVTGDDLEMALEAFEKLDDYPFLNLLLLTTECEELPVRS